MSILDTYWSGIRHYATWQTAVSCGSILFVLAVAWTVAYATRNRRKSSRRSV